MRKRIAAPSRAPYVFRIAIGLLLSAAAVFLLFAANEEFQVPDIFVYLLLALGGILVAFGVFGIIQTMPIKAKMRIILVDRETQVHLKPDPGSPLVARLNAGSTVKAVGGRKSARGILWTAVVLVDGHRGYVPGQVHFETLLKARTLAEIPVFQFKGTQSRQIARLPTGGELEISATDWRKKIKKKTEWVRILLPDGTPGYVKGAILNVKWMQD